MFLLQQPVQELVERGPWWEEALRQGGLAAVCLILAFVAWTLLRFYRQERDAKDAAIKNQIKEAERLQGVYQQREDEKLKEQTDRYQRVIENKDAIIDRLEEKNDQIEKQFRADLTSFLKDSIETRHVISKSLEDHGRDMREQNKEIIRTLQNMS
jgi:putative cell wall-binding protein